MAGHFSEKIFYEEFAYINEQEVINGTNRTNGLVYIMAGVDIFL